MVFASYVTHLTLYAWFDSELRISRNVELFQIHVSKTGSTEYVIYSMIALVTYCKNEHITYAVIWNINCMRLYYIIEQFYDRRIK